ncbi:MAG: hypothetical protein AAB870_05235 [Patescibacteria group bacterium]
MLQTYIFVAIAIIAGALGNVLIKIGTQRLPHLDVNLAFIGTAIRDPYLVIGIILMVGSFPFYAEVFQRLPLHVAFPIIAGSTFILIDIASYFFLHETLTMVNVVGMMVVIIGLILMSYR